MRGPGGGLHRALGWGLAAAGAAASALLLAVFARLRPEELGLARLLLVPAGLLLGAALFALGRGREPGAAAGGGRATGEVRRGWAVALGLWCGAVPFWLGLALFGGAPELEWARWPYLDKRWLVGLYWSSWLAALAAPPLAAGLLRGAAAGDSARDAGREAGREPRRGAGRRVGAALAAALLATLAFGPPWHGDASARPVDAHETVNWSGLQGIHAGHPPYIGPASNNYGPGLQLVTYAYMRASGEFSVPGYRASHGLAAWVALALVGAFAGWRGGLGLGLGAVVVGLFVSPLALWRWSAEGALDGFFGWANALRQVAPVLLALALCGLARGPRGRWRDVAAAAGIGLLWGASAWYSQENLVGGGMALAVLIALLVAAGSLARHRLLPMVGGLAAGALTAVAPVVVWYGARGLLGEFWANYSLVPGRVLRGYGNTPWSGGLTSDGFTVPYYTLPYLVALLALLALYRFRPLRFCRPLAGGRLIVVATAVAFLCSYPGAMLRADFPHLIGTLFPLAVLLPAAWLHLPAALSGDPLRRAVVRVTLLGVFAAAFLPLVTWAPERARELAVGRAAALGRAGGGAAQGEAGGDRPVDPVTRRLGPTLSRLDRMRGELRFLRRLRAVVGGEPVLVLTGPPELDIRDPAFYGGYVYFLADLEPGPVSLERTDMVADSRQVEAFLRHFERHAREFGAVVSSRRTSPEIRLFREAWPAARLVRVERPAGPPFWVARRP